MTTKPLEQTKKILNQAAFTLIEMMIVLAIIAMILGFIGTNMIRRFDEARHSSTIIQIRQLGTALDDFKRVCGTYPTTAENLDALLKLPAGRNCKNYDPEGILKGTKLPKDAWGNDFIYTSDGNKYTIRSFGPTGREDGKGQISSDDLD